MGGAGMIPLPVYPLSRTNTVLDSSLLHSSKSLERRWSSDQYINRQCARTKQHWTLHSRPKRQWRFPHRWMGVIRGRGCVRIGRRLVPSRYTKSGGIRWQNRAAGQQRWGCWTWKHYLQRGLMRRIVPIVSAVIQMSENIYCTMSFPGVIAWSPMEVLCKSSCATDRFWNTLELRLRSFRIVDICAPTTLPILVWFKRLGIQTSTASYQNLNNTFQTM